MDRLFSEHKFRKTTLLDGVWKFVTASSDIPLDKIPDEATDMYVPSCWNLRLGLLEYQGYAWYYKEFYSESENTVITFGAVSGTAKVYIDGKLSGSHYGGYTAFSVKATLKKGKHLLAVSVDSSSDDETVPKSVADWYRYGGIYRSVELAELGDTYINNVKIEYTLSGNNAEVTVNTDTETFSGKAPEEMTVRFDGKTVYDGEYRESISFTAGNIELWDVGKPSLYFVEVTVDGDDITESIGFRTVEVKDGKFLLNGREIEIKGVNHHEDWPDFGHAVPKQLAERDIDIIKDLGCNFVRGSHYPNSQSFVDYLDRNGILFWTEVPLWGAAAETLSSELLISRTVNMYRELLVQYGNHPSVALWGLHNEIDTRVEPARALTEKLISVIKEYDKSRPITYATDKIEDDICLDLVDIISINKYVGWYGGKKEAWVDFLKGVDKKLKAEHLENKPIIMSEFGASALYGYHTFDNVKWTEEYQAELLEYELRLFSNTPGIIGYFIWQFADGRTSSRNNDRVKGFNNKGILNEYRKPKMSYGVVKKLYRK